MIKNIFFIRHGEVEYSRNEKGETLVYGPMTPLSDLGKQQLEALGKEFKKKKIDLEIIYSSSYERAKKSAEIFISKLSLQVPLVLTKELRDVDNFGWRGKTIKEYTVFAGDIYSHRLDRKDETLRQLSKRAINIFKKIMKTKHRSLAIFSHGDFLSALVWTLEHKDFPPNYQEMKKNFYLEKGQAVQYKIDESLKIVKRVKIITVENVKKSIEYWRK